MKKLVFVGAGAMAEALISGMIENQVIDSKNIWVTNRSNKQKLENLEKQYGVQATYDLKKLFDGADTIVLAMKPKDAIPAIRNISDYINEQMLVASVLAGISISTIEELTGKQIAVARAMPNTSAAVGKSATGVAVNDQVSEYQMETIKKLFGTVGLTTFVAEDQLDAVTGLSGSGPAYIYYVVEALEKGAVEMGMEKKAANELIVQTLLGAAEMLKTSPKPAAKLRQEVTSPGGTTEAGINVLKENAVESAFIACVKAAADKSKEMGKTLNAQIHSTKQTL